MIPKSLSASSIHVSTLCLARWKGEYLDKGEDIGTVPAQNGSAVHSALEQFVKVCYIDKSALPDLGLLLDLYRLYYMQELGTANTDTQDFADGVDMLERWFKRNLENKYFERNTILTAEVKENFPVPTPSGYWPYNYIIDRFDVSNEEEGVYRVVDYKTIRRRVSSAELRDKIQARSYSLAMRMKYPDAKRIYVEFDMLRHDGPIGAVFTEADDKATYKRIKAEARKIHDTPETDVEERLNPECRFCIRKQSCKAILSNVRAGGVFTITSAEEAIDTRAALEYQLGAVNSAIDEIDQVILAESRETDTLEWKSDYNKIFITASRTRGADPERIERIVGPTIFAEYASMKMTMANLDKLLKRKDLSNEQKNEIRAMIYYTYGEPRVKAAPISPIDED